MEKAPPPPGTILAAGGLIGTGLATLILVAPTIPSRLADSPFADRLASFDLALDALGVVFALAMLACAVGLVVRGASFVTWALALVVVHGIFQLGGAAIEKTLFGGTSTLLTLRLAFVVATGVLCFAPLLAAYVLLEKRRYGSAAPARRGSEFVIVEGCVACVFLAASILAMGAYSRSLAALVVTQAQHEEQEPAEAATPGAGSFTGSEPAASPAPTGAATEDALDPAAEAGAAIFTSHLPSNDGRSRALWEKGPAATLVDFWASWCGPCLYELPNLQALHQRLGDRGLRVVLVNVDLNEPEDVKRFLVGRRIGLGSLVDRDGSVFQELGLRALPSMFLLDAQGRPVQSYVGAEDPRVLEQDILGVLSAAERSRARPG